MNNFLSCQNVNRPKRESALSVQALIAKIVVLFFESQNASITKILSVNFPAKQIYLVANLLKLTSKKTNIPKLTPSEIHLASKQIKQDATSVCIWVLSSKEHMSQL